MSPLTPHGEIWQWALGRRIDDPNFDESLRRGLQLLLDDVPDLHQGFSLVPDAVSETVVKVVLYNDQTQHTWPGLRPPSPSDPGRFHAYQGKLPGDANWNMTARDVGAVFRGPNQVSGFVEIPMPPGMTFAYNIGPPGKIIYELRVEFWALTARDLPNALIRSIEIRAGRDYRPVGDAIMTRSSNQTDWTWKPSPAI